MFVHLNITGQFAYNEDFYNYGMLISQIVGTPINLFTLFVVLKFSTPEMGQYKKHLIMYVVASALLDFGIDTLSTPVFFLPHPAGTCQGLLRTVFGLETFTVYIIMLCWIGLSLHFICANLIFYRWQLILPSENFWKLKSNLSYCLMDYGYLSVAAFGPLACYLGVVDDTSVVSEEFKQAFPNDSNLVNVDGFYWANIDKHPLIVFALGIHTICFVIMMAMVFFCSLHSIGVLQDLTHNMSTATRAAHKRFMRQLWIQTMVPLLQIEIPSIYWIQVVQYRIRFQGMQNVTTATFLFCCNHGAVASFFLLYINRPYRQAMNDIFVNPLRKCLRLQNKTVAVVRRAPASVEDTTVHRIN